MIFKWKNIKIKITKIVKLSNNNNNYTSEFTKGQNKYKSQMKY